MDVLEAIRIRRSVREYSPRAIPPEVVEQMRAALRSAPSACNYQPWHFVFVTDAELRRRVASACNKQHWMADAPVTVVACGVTERAYPRMAGRYSSLEIDVAIALDHLSLAAAAAGLGTCWIGAFDEAQVKKLVGIPEKVRVVALMPLGYPAEAALMHPLVDAERRPAAEIFSVDQYGG